MLNCPICRPIMVFPSFASHYTTKIRLFWGCQQSFYYALSGFFAMSIFQNNIFFLKILYNIIKKTVDSRNLDPHRHNKIQAWHGLYAVFIDIMDNILHCLFLYFQI